MEPIEAQRDAPDSGINRRLEASLGKYAYAVSAAMEEAERGDVLGRIWRKDAALWKEDEKSQQLINNALGWLTVVDTMIGAEDELAAFAEQIRSAGRFEHVMLCGMGGSSLCPEVLRRTFGHQEGYPELLVLDSTDPDTLKMFADQIDVTRCLFLIASKSGTTIEPLSFYKYWYDQVSQRQPDPGQNFVAITDPGTLMLKMATGDKFRRIFLNPPDIGGRYSALSYFGMVPAALMGLDFRTMLERAARVVQDCAIGVPAADNPCARLGAIMGECARAGRDKLTIITDPRIEALGLWIEQLVAESTGKEGKGIVPVTGEPLGPPSVYGEDRLFVSLAVGEPTGEMERGLKALEAAGHVVVYRTLSDIYDLGEEFFLWEIATAFAGYRLGINPFDQPNVQESKDATNALLAEFVKEGALEEQTLLVTDGTLSVYADERTRAASPASSVLEALRAHLGRAGSGDYVALLNYIEETPEHEALIQAVRTRLRDATRCATTTGYGPRFLHSTGQLHKGGPDTGVFIQVTAPDRVDLPIPGQPYTFGVLKQAQALGDFHSLSSRGRRAIRVDLGTDTLAGLKRLNELTHEALPLSAGEAATK